MKKPLVMLHGFGTDSRIFASFGHKLSKDHDVLMVDLPGHGQTKEHFGDFSFAAYTISHALDTYLDGQPYNLLGWSMGGQVALEMYRLQTKLAGHKHKHEHEHQECGCGHDHVHDHCDDKESCEAGKMNISSLILISTTPKFVDTKDFSAGMNKAVFHKFRKNIKDTPDKALEEFYGLMFNDNEKALANMDEIKKMRPSDDTLNACMVSFEDKDERGVLPLIVVPTLIITGDLDRIVAPKASMYMSQEVRTSTLKIFKDTGHAPFISREKEMIEEINAFIR
jgi:pimeloyl-[acyl-carrier protein] methyl ester esterase